MTRLTALLGAALLLAVPNAHANCGTGLFGLDYRVPNVWRPPDGGRAARFSPACAAHDRCYQTLGESRRACDDRLKADLDKVCNRAYATGTSVHGRCHATVNLAIAYIEKKGRTSYRRYQRKLERQKRTKERAARRAKRRQDDM